MISFLPQDQVEDVRDVRGAVRAIIRTMTTVKYLSVTIVRASQLPGRLLPALGRGIKQLNHLLTGADAAWQVQIGPGLSLLHPTGEVVGLGLRIGAVAKIRQGATLGGRGRASQDGSLRLGHSVPLGAGAQVLGPIELGDQVVVGANGVVLRSLASSMVAAGNPGPAIADTSRSPRLS
jgi:serine O-acetyltransferase